MEIMVAYSMTSTYAKYSVVKVLTGSNPYSKPEISTGFIYGSRLILKGVERILVYCDSVEYISAYFNYIDILYYTVKSPHFDLLKHHTEQYREAFTTDWINVINKKLHLRLDHYLPICANRWIK